MFGSGVLKNIANRPIEEGIANLAIRGLFGDGQQDATVSVSFLEIYNEQVKDLLSQNANTEQNNLLILEDPHKGVTI